MTILVGTSSNGGLPPEYWAKRLRDKLISVSNTAPRPIRDQAEAFKARIGDLGLALMKQAIKSDRSTIIFKLRAAGMNEAAALVESL